MKAPKTVFTCSECGYTTSKWMGKCPECGKWNTFNEEGEVLEEPKAVKRVSPSTVKKVSVKNPAAPYGELTLPEYFRFGTGMSELDRVLGGGLVSGSVVLLAGEPGIGKSTLLTQICGSLGKDKRILYVSGEESHSQLKLRAERLGIGKTDMYVLTETDIDSIISEIDRIKPEIVVVDSIQTVYSEEISSIPGSVTQVKESAMRFIGCAKTGGISIIIVGHVNKEGGIAGPKVLEHMVDAVLYFEGDRQNSYRIIRAIKNRFGSTNELGVFEMREDGLSEVKNPSEMLLCDRPKNVSGNCAVCIMEGTRPLIAEIQALVTRTSFPSPKRTSNGVDYNRMFLLLAVLEKRLGLKFSENDVYLNVVGGLRLDDVASDLAVTLALISGIRDLVIPDDLICIGEVGLAGECRAVSNVEQRIKEAARLGFSRILVPKRNYERLSSGFSGAEVIPVTSVFDMISQHGIFK